MPIGSDPLRWWVNLVGSKSIVDDFDTVIVDPVLFAYILMESNAILKPILIVILIL